MKKLASVLPDILIVLGAGSLSYGAWLTYNPAGFAVAGALMIFAAVKMADKA